MIIVDVSEEVQYNAPTELNNEQVMQMFLRWQSQPFDEVTDDWAPQSANEIK